MREAEVTDDRVEVPPSPGRPVLLRPFRALRLAPDLVADPSSARAMSRPYAEVAEQLRRWEAEGRVLQDPHSAIQLHAYTVSGVTVRGVVGVLDLTTRARTAAERAVVPHEAIHTAQADDLAERMQDLGLDPAPILLVHHGSAELRRLLDQVAAQVPDHAFTDRAGQQHRLWSVRDEDVVEQLTAALAPSTLLIADGHHRYAAYLRLQERTAARGWDGGLAMVVDQLDTPFRLGAIHRVLHGTSLGALRAAAERSGAVVTELSRAEAVDRLDAGAWTATDGTRWLSVDMTGAPGHRSAVEDLHQLALARLERPPTATTYHHSVTGALEELTSTPATCAVLLPAPDQALLQRTLRERRLLPEKATSFQPKPSLGTVMRAIEE